VTASVVAWTAFWAGAVSYLAASVLFFLQISRGLPPRLARLGPALIGLGALSHAVFITLASLVANICPVRSVNFALSVGALATSLGYLIARMKWRIDAVGVFVAPIGLTFLIASRLANLGAVDAELPPFFLALHVGVNLIGDALFLLACTTAVLYLVVEKRLKEKKLGGVLGRLPSLDVLDQAEHRFMLFGFPLLTLGIITGTAWAYRLEAGHADEVLRAAFAYLTWAVFAGVLLMRAAAGWRGRRAALGTITGFFFAVLVLVVYLVRPPAGPV
jgi:ABC-type uncharacterized transport system permease subunit